ncbi:MAG: methyl-accepting chemotaxis protein [Polaromonas sp.]|nr:methyl-accepting chemotaxis protein [Polaromonas sp.]
MSVLEQFQKIFKTKSPQPADSVDMSSMGAAPDSVAVSMDDMSMSATAVREAGSDDAFGSGSGDASDQVLAVPDADLLKLPLLGQRTIAQHQRILLSLLGLSVLVLGAVAYRALNQAETVSQQVAATGQSLMQSQRLAKSVSQALVGSAQAFPDVRESSDVLAKTVRGLKSSDDSLQLKAVSQDLQPDIEKVVPLMEKAEKNAATVMGQQHILTQVGHALRTINRQSSDLLEIAETVSSLKLQQNAPPAEISASGQLVMLTQRIGKSANEFLTMEGVSPEAVFLLGKDLNSFKEISQGLQEGSPELRLTGSKDPQTRERLEALMALYEQTRVQAGAILGNLQGLVSAREAQASILADSEPLRRGLEDLQSKLSSQSGLGAGSVAALIVAALFGLTCAIGIARVQLQDSRQRQTVAERRQLEARGQEQDAKRVNDANQAAILRLMNELQTVAEGDLTQEATVTEDITGAIADSVNYTVEELRQLVGNVQNTATRVAQTTAQVESTSTELLAASTEQLREIRETGQSVLDMASRINEVSTQAQESSHVARQSLTAAESGLQAVQNAIGGMNSIRDQIQETSKRIKRLGESSQEIGEITELISDITEQTNVLALNAAIQAASAGEAGRGFSVVAEEVQRLAERSADATRQISALVKAIQTDTQDAVAAMERSTQGVVEGAKLSDNAGTALSEIDRVSRRLADLIEQISKSASREAESANVVAGNIQHIFAVTEQTGEGTRSTAQQVRDLSRMAEELRQSVSRFKIA